MMSVNGRSKDTIFKNNNKKTIKNLISLLNVNKQFNFIKSAFGASSCNVTQNCLSLSLSVFLFPKLLLHYTNWIFFVVVFTTTGWEELAARRTMPAATALSSSRRL